jgi:serine/threonine protein kinase/tetratricopeptide (TPR) repeat protein
MIGSTISHYKVLEELGRGGMGVVYKAQDLKLDRIVALKFLPHRLAASEAEQARFLQEAKAASALNHPNVCNVHSIGEERGQSFIDMEFVEGQTLRTKVASGPLQLDDAIAYAIQIGEALHEAHLKGIVHRDIKCENIMINTRNQIKVMDFGLAKLKGSLKLTKSSSTVGTLAYMAPEQIQGGEIDGRSDIFSFGVVIFEMLTGKLPFRGEHDAAIMYSILNEEPEPLQRYLPEASSVILHVINKSLEKDPADRYQSVAEMVIDLRRVKKDSTRVSRATAQIPALEEARLSLAAPTSKKLPPGQMKLRLATAAVGVVLVVAALFLTQPWKSGSAHTGPKTLVVLPFENLGDPTREYFADGITDEITSRLSRIPGLGIIARSSAKEYKKSSKSLGEIGKELGVDYILMGTVRWSGGGEQRVRVSPELIDANTSLQKWSQAFDAPFSDAFKIQADVSSEVASALDIELLQRDKENLGRRVTDSPQAYDYYLKGLEYSNRGIAQVNLESEIRMFEQAIAADPDFAAACAKLSRAHAMMYWMYYDRTERRIARAREAAERALQLDPLLADAHAALGWYYYQGKLDYENALRQFGLALQYQPNNSDVHQGIAAVKRRQGQMNEAVESFKRAVAADPRSAEVLRELGETLTLARRYEEGEAAYERTIQLAPDNDLVYASKALNIILRTGDLERAATAIAEATEKRIRSETVLSMRLRIEWYRGDKKAADATVEEIRPLGDIDNQFVYTPVSMLRARLEQTVGEPARARPLFEEARVKLETRLAANSDDGRLHSSLGIVYAYLGRKDDSIREAKKGVDILPVEKEAWRGSYRLIDLADVYTVVGEHDKALDLLERLVSIPAEFSRQLIKIDPRWKPLKENKRFQALVRGT